jgi:hypothetical protein
LYSNGVADIGPATHKILQARKSYGRFKSVNDLLAVRGVGPKRLEKMRKIPNGGRPTTAASQKTKRSGCGNEATPSQPAAANASDAPKKPSATDDHHEEEP